MDILSFIGDLIVYTSIFICSFYIFKKATNYCCTSKTIIFLAIVLSILLSLSNYILRLFLPNIVTLLILFILLSVIISTVAKKHFSFSLITGFISLCISFTFYITSLFTIALIVSLTFPNTHEDNPILYLLIAPLHFAITYKFFTMKKFRNGFYFLKTDNETLNIISIVGFILSGFIFISLSLFNTETHYSLAIPYLLAFSLISIGIYIWIARNSRLSFNQNMDKRTKKLLLTDNAEKDKQISSQAKLIQNLSIINHKYNTKIEALEHKILKFKNATDTEFSNEISDITELIGDLSKDYNKEIRGALQSTKKLQKTNIPGIDIMLEYMQSQCFEKDINFKLDIFCSVISITENHVEPKDLETLLGDHIKDAIIAVEHSSNSIKDIYVLFELIDNCYQLSIFDSGINFDIETLVKLGIEQHTTHKDSGGSGLGFITTFKTLSKCKVSLIISELNFNNSNFSKSITFKFDRNNEYIISSNRSEDILKEDSLNRIKVMELN